MAYGFSTSAFIATGAADLAERLRKSRTTARAWAMLDRANRLAAVERALCAANDDCCDGFPLAL